MDKDKLASLEDKGAEAVLMEVVLGDHGSAPDSVKRLDVEAWLRLDSLRRNSASDAEHLRIASQQTKIAIVAIVVSAITAVAAVVIGVFLSRS